MGKIHVYNKTHYRSSRNLQGRILYGAGLQAKGKLHIFFLFKCWNLAYKQMDNDSMLNKTIISIIIDRIAVFFDSAYSNE